MKNQFCIVCLVVFTVFFIGGCANKSMEDKHSGFLKSYSGLKDVAEGRKLQIMPGADFAKYKNLYVAPVQILHGIVEGVVTPSEKKLFQEMSDYLTEGLKKDTKKNGILTLTEDKKAPQTMVFESAISAVAVNFDDMSWYQFTPITMAATAAARASVVDKQVRILGEARLSDGDTGSVLMRVVNLQKGHEVAPGTEVDDLVFADVQPALDAWLKQYSKNLASIRKK